ncbi:MAG: hypothetical protein WA672_01975 [Candidatus Angelobacter sp.]
MMMRLVESPGLADEAVAAAGDGVGCGSPLCAQAGKDAPRKMVRANTGRGAMAIAGFYRQILYLCQHLHSPALTSEDDESVPSVYREPASTIVDLLR